MCKYSDTCIGTVLIRGDSSMLGGPILTYGPDTWPELAFQLCSMLYRDCKTRPWLQAGRRGRGRRGQRLGQGEVCWGREVDAISRSHAANILSHFSALIHLPRSTQACASRITDTDLSRGIVASLTPRQGFKCFLTWRRFQDFPSSCRIQHALWWHSCPLLCSLLFLQNTEEGGGGAAGTEMVIVRVAATGGQVPFVTLESPTLMYELISPFLVGFVLWFSLQVFPKGQFLSRLRTHHYATHSQPDLPSYSLNRTLHYLRMHIQKGLLNWLYCMEPLLVPFDEWPTTH